MMMEYYRNAMDRIAASPQFKALLMEKLDTADIKAPAKKAKNSIRIPIMASLASAAVLALLVYSSTVIVLPMLRNDEYEFSIGKLYNDPGKITGPDATAVDGTDSQPDVTTDGDTSSQTNDYTVSEVNHDQIVQSADTSDSDSETGTISDIFYYDNYNVVTYAGAPARALKSSRASGNLYDYDAVFHFKFEGFDEYGVAIKTNDVIFTTSLYDDYTIGDLFVDYYTAIISRRGRVRINNGLLDNFFDIPAGQNRQISVFIDGVEVVNLNNVQLCEFRDLTDVYFTVSIT